MFKDLIQRREMLVTLISRNLKIRYQGSALGFLWTLLNPLFMMLIYWMFIRLMRFQMDLPSLLTGILAWQFLTMCCHDAINSVAGHPNLVKKVYFPRIILPISTVLANLINYLLSLLVLFIFCLAMGRLSWGSALAALPVVIGLQFLLCMGLALVISCSSVYYRDTEHVVGVLLMAWFFLSPVIYSLDFIMSSAPLHRWLLSLYKLNPMVGIITLYRQCILNTAAPGWLAILAASFFSLLILFAGLRFFLRHEPDFADEL